MAYSNSVFLFCFLFCCFVLDFIQQGGTAEECRLDEFMPDYGWGLVLLLMFSSGPQAASNGCLGHTLPIAGSGGSKLSQVMQIYVRALLMSYLTFHWPKQVLWPSLTLPGQRIIPYTLTTVKRRGRMSCFFLFFFEQ